MRRKLAWVIVVPVVAWTLVRTLGAERGFPLVPLMAWTPYAALAAVAMAGVSAGLRERWAVLATGTCALILVGSVAPRALGGPSDPVGRPGAELRVLTVNMRRGGANPLDIAVLALKADVVSLQEIDAEAIGRLRRVGFMDDFRYSVVRLRNGWNGTALFARFPLHALPVPEHNWNAVARATANVGGTQIELTAVHPPAPVTGERAAELRAELGRLPSAGGERIRLLIGDFNATLDLAALRDLLDRGYEDAAESLGQGLQPTWPVGGPRWWLPVTIDHVLADRRSGFKSLTVRSVLRTDHRAVLARVVLPR